MYCYLRKGIEKDRNDAKLFKIRVCNACFQSIKYGSTFESRNPPKFSIANGFAIGELPKYLSDTT